MNKYFIFLIACFGFTLKVAGQSGLVYSPKEIHVQVPIELPGLQQDTLARKGDFLVYDVTGQEIKDTVAYELHQIVSSDKSTPWMVLGELLDAYKSGSLEKITELYTKSSRALIDKFLSAADAKEKFLSNVKDIKTMHPYFIMDYDNGLIALVETSPGNADRFRFEKQGDKYMLAAYEEKNNMMVNNVMAYYFYRPQPHLTPALVQSIDSLKSDESPFITFRLNKPGDWISVFIPLTGYSVELQEQDGGLNDYDHSNGSVKLIFYGSNFPTGNLDLEAVESNYPPNLISNSMVNTGLKFKVKVKE
jgi:hypothetical protein